MTEFDKELEQIQCRYWVCPSRDKDGDPCGSCQLRIVQSIYAIHQALAKVVGEDEDPYYIDLFTKERVKHGPIVGSNELRQRIREGLGITT